MHAAAGVEGLVRIEARAVEDFQRIAGRVAERHEFQHAPLGGKACIGDFVRDAGVAQHLDQGREFLRPGHA